MFDKLSQMMELKKQAETLKRELESRTVELSEGGIKITISGSQAFKSIEIDPGMLNPEDKQRFESQLLHCLNLAIKKSQGVVMERLQGMAGSYFPGLYN